MTFLGLEARTDLPKVSYPTALDFFVFLSFAFIFATILQFAIVHYFTKYGSGECYFNFLEDSDESESEEDDAAFFQQSRLSSLAQIDSVDMYGVIPLSRFELDIDEGKKSSDAAKSFRKFMAKYFFCLSFSKGSEDGDDEVSHESADGSIIPCELHMDSGASTATQNTPQCRRHSSQSLKQPRGGFRRNFNSVSKVDKFSRVGFPLLFFVINLIYWIFYLSRSQRK
jgi:gamma-aminobutyric acid receptor subunit alpha